MDYLIARGKELSTWQGIVAGVTAFGVALSPELQAAIGAAGVGIFTLISVFWTEKKAE